MTFNALMIAGPAVIDLPSGSL